MFKLLNNKYCKSAAAFITLFLTPTFSFARYNGPSSMDDTLAQTLVIIIVALLLVIGLLAYVFSGAAQLYAERIKEEKKNKEGVAVELKITSILAALLISGSILAQEAVTAPASTSTAGTTLSSVAFFTLVSVIVLELVIIFALLYNLQLLLRKEVLVAVTETVPAAENKLAIWWTKINSFKPAKEEADIDLGHDYDGIRELDNNLPPWWKYGFYLCIFIGVVYLWRFHVSQTAPLSKEEYEVAMKAGEIEKEAYLAKAANKVDENSVTMLTGSDIEAGKKMFTTVCAACHLADGGGAVGPNLTDDYWMHGGSMKEVFISIKYGWQEKGMKSWKDDFSPVQIAQIASYVKSLKGTKPAKAKEPQGEVFKEYNTSKDTTASKAVAVIK